MTWLARLRPSRLLNHRVGMTLLWGVFVAAIAAAVNVSGIQIVGSIDGWKSWLHAHVSHFFAWRLLLYAATVCGWWQMRQRLTQREPSAEARQRFVRIEIAAVATLVLLEGSQVLQQS